MTTLNATIPDDLHRDLLKQAEREHLGLDEVVARALRASISLPLLRLSVKERDARGDWADFDRIMTCVPDVPPVPGDEIDG